MGLRLVVIGKGKPTCISSFPHFGTPSSPAGFKQRTACIQKAVLTGNINHRRRIGRDGGRFGQSGTGNPKQPRRGRPQRARRSVRRIELSPYFSVLTLTLPALLALPGAQTILSVNEASRSAWARGFRVDARHSSGTEESYFMKVCRVCPAPFSAPWVS